jgi:hypothetical protein
MEDPSVDGRKIFRLLFKKWDVGDMELIEMV